MNIEATYRNREGEEWRLTQLTPHPFAPLVFVMAIRHDGKQVCVEKSKLRPTTVSAEQDQANGALLKM